MAKKRVYEVVNNSVHKKGLRVGNSYYRYGKNGVFTVKDPDVGKELKNLYDGTDAVVNEVEMSTNLEAGHKYTFSGVDMSGFKASPNNDKVWARSSVLKPWKHMKREEAIAEGYEIMPQKRIKRASVRRVVQGE